MNDFINKYSQYQIWTTRDAEKVPRTITGSNASSTNPLTWEYYEELKKRGITNFSVALPQGILNISPIKNNLIIIDIDHCLIDLELSKEVYIDNLNSNNIKTFHFDIEYKKIKQLLETLNTYTEISLSQQGLHIILNTEKPFIPTKCRVNHLPYEIYTHSKILSFSGNIFKNYSEVKTISNDDFEKALQIIGYDWEKTIPTSSNSNILSNETIIEKLLTSNKYFEELYNGDTSNNNNDQSSAEYSLIGMFCFYTRDVIQLTELMKEAPLCQRAKVQIRTDYLQNSIKNKILELEKKGAKVYDPNYYSNNTNNNSKEIIPTELKFDTLNEFIDTKHPDIDYLLKPYIEIGGLNLISASPSSYKTWFYLYIIKHISQGTEAFKHPAFPCVKTTSLIINDDDTPKILQNRLKMLDINKTETNTEGNIFFYCQKSFKINKKLIDELLIKVKEKNIGLIVFDTFRNVHLANENDATEMQIVIDELKRLTKENITIILIHHHKKRGLGQKSSDPELARGSTGISGALTGHLIIEDVSKGEDKKIIIYHSKSKSCEKHKPITLSIKLENNKFDFNFEGETKDYVLQKNKSAEYILNELTNTNKLYTRKDLEQLDIGSINDIRNATIELEKEKKIISILGKDITKEQQQLFYSDNKKYDTEKLYFIFNLEEPIIQQKL